METLANRLRCDFILNYQIPFAKGNKFNFKVALRNCKEINQMDNTHLPSNGWRQLFKYVEWALNVEVHQKKVHYLDLTQIRIDGNHSWNAFTTLCFVNYLLIQRLEVPSDMEYIMKTWEVGNIGSKLYVWKLILELVIMIYKDENITSKLNEFNSFFKENKKSLILNNGVFLSVTSTFSIRIQLPSIFNYKDIKNILLLLQSVSYLSNCYDTNANYSTVFLPKVLKTTEKLMKSLFSGDTGVHESVRELDCKYEWYQTLTKTCHFYQTWEKLILQPSSFLTKNLSLDEEEKSVLKSIALQLTKGQEREAIKKYNEIINQRSMPNEIRMFALLNTYTILTALISRNESRQENLEMLGGITDQMEKLFSKTDLRFNPVWHCTITVLWILSHFEPFTKNPLPSTEEQKSAYLDILKKYYLANKLVNADPIKDSNLLSFKLKKSLLLQILINYLGGRLFETDLETICLLSSTLFRISKKQPMDSVQYILGLWHMMNSTVSMNAKEIAVTKARLESLTTALESRSL